jgi:hypothetical protein
VLFLFACVASAAWHSDELQVAEKYAGIAVTANAGWTVQAQLIAYALLSNSGVQHACCM